MEILGVGPTEFLFIVIIALILIGPKDMEKTGRAIGKWLNDFVKSDVWQVMKGTSKIVSDLPTQLMREANLEEQKANPNPNIPKPEEMEAFLKAPKEYQPAGLATSQPAAASADVVQPSAEAPILVDTPEAAPAVVPPTPPVVSAEEKAAKRRANQAALKAAVEKQEQAAREKEATQAATAKPKAAKSTKSTTRKPAAKKTSTSKSTTKSSKPRKSSDA